MASLSNFRRQTRKERLNRSTNNGDMANLDKRYVVCEEGSESVGYTLVRELLFFYKFKIYQNYSRYENLDLSISPAGAQNRNVRWRCGPKFPHLEKKSF